VPLSCQVCFKRGSCQCGKCLCEPGFEGKYCQKPAKGDLSACKKLEPCVKATLFKANVSQIESDDWIRECKTNTEFNGIQLFGKKMYTACRLQDKNVNSTSCKQDYLYSLAAPLRSAFSRKKIPPPKK
jgi:hypothetical protein